MNKVKKNEKKLISKSDINSFFDGLDISILLNLSPFIAIYFFEEFSNTKLSIIFTICLILVSFAIRSSYSFFFRSLQRIKYDLHKFLSLILILSYVLVLIIPNNILFLTLFFLLINRIIVGYFNAIFFSPLIENHSKKMSKYFNVKLWLLFLGGIFVGLFFCKIINQTYSNLQLINGFWKIGFIPIIALLLIKFFMDKKDKSMFDYYNDEANSLGFKFGKEEIKAFYKNIAFIVPVLVFLVFIMSSWLSTYVIPENRQISQLSHINVILLLMVFVCANFIFRLFKKFLPFNIVSISAVTVFTILFFVSNDTTSYNIALLHFTISIFAGLSMSVFKLDIEINKNTFSQNFIGTFYLYTLIISIITPIMIYYLLFNSVQFQNIYLLLLILYTVSYFGHFLSSRTRKN